MENDYLVNKALRDIEKGLPSIARHVSADLVASPRSDAQKYLSSRIKANTAGKNASSMIAGGDGKIMRWSSAKAENAEPYKVVNSGESLSQEFGRRFAPKLREISRKNQTKLSIDAGKRYKADSAKVLNRGK